ncbi:MAG TPA: glycosyltransferase [Candidatus Saccharimonadales bacterium]|nr:glycosyltransferase [Candidatus Saccharimonadales bacterium]
MRQPIVSIIVTTRNNTATLDACLASIATQTYEACELIVVDNNSTDNTKAIARRYTTHVYNKGPERSAQRNYAVQKSNGHYVLIIDSDMELGADVVSACVQKVEAGTGVRALIIPEESFGKGFWAQCKRLERSFYVGVDTIEAARFFDKELYQQVGGYDETLTGGEDWDLTRRIRLHTQIGRIHEFIRHNEGRPHFMRTVRKMYYYGQHAAEYFSKNPTNSALTDQSGPLARYKLFFSKPYRLFKNPAIGVGMLVLKTSEYASGALGYARARSTHSQFSRKGA